LLECSERIEFMENKTLTSSKKDISTSIRLVGVGALRH
jgi:hypothetical protein